MNAIELIGCGGIGSWLAPQLGKLMTSDVWKFDRTIRLWDGDLVERGNLDRQWFSKDDIGKPKVECTARVLREMCPGLEVKEENGWFSDRSIVADDPIIICCADNHLARRHALAVADDRYVQAIICGNEYVEAEAYTYDPNNMMGLPTDPRTYYPDLLTDESGAPDRPAGCTGEITKSSPQLGMANQFAAVAAMYLLWTWMVDFPQELLDPEDNEVFGNMPVIHRISKFRTHTIRVKDLV